MTQIDKDKKFKTKVLETQANTILSSYIMTEEEFDLTKEEKLKHVLNLEKYICQKEKNIKDCERQVTTQKQLISSYRKCISGATNEIIAFKKSITI